MRSEIFLCGLTESWPNTYLQLHMTVHRRPGHAVALRLCILARLQRDLHLGHRVPGVAELCFIKPAQVPHKGNLDVGVPHVPDVYLHVGPVLHQSLYDQRMGSSLPDQSAESSPEDPVLVGLIHHLPVNNPDGHYKEDSHPQTGYCPFPRLVHLLQSRVPCYLRDGTGVPISSVGHVCFSDQQRIKLQKCKNIRVSKISVASSYHTLFVQTSKPVSVHRLLSCSVLRVIVPATVTCHVKKAVRKINPSEETNKHELTIDLPHTVAALKSLCFYIALAAVSSGAAPSRVWQQHLRLAPPSLPVLHFLT